MPAKKKNLSLECINLTGTSYVKFVFQQEIQTR